MEAADIAYQRALEEEEEARRIAEAD